MSEDKIQSLETKNPKATALNKIKEALQKDFSNKIDAQVRKTFDARKIYLNEKKLLVDLVEEQKEALSEFSNVSKEI